MKIVGRVHLEHAQSRAITPGGTIDIPLIQFYTFVPYVARIGDLIWVQERFSHFVMKHGRKLEAFVPGPVGTYWYGRSKNPNFCFGECEFERCEARFLPRRHSRATLEIMGFCDHSVRCMVHMVQVDDFVKTRAAA